MLSIIDNVPLSSRASASMNPWLQTILLAAQRFEGDVFVARLTSEPHNQKVLYTLENSRNKTIAYLSKKGTTIRVETFRRAQPRPTRYIKPGFEPVCAHLYEDTPEDLTRAAKALHDVLGTHTRYSLNNVLKARVYDIARPTLETAFSGGIITGILYEGATQHITVDNHTVYSLTSSQFLSSAIPKLLKYLVVDNKNNAEVVNESEFDFYFEMRHAITKAA